MNRRGREIAAAIECGDLVPLAERGEMATGVRLGGVIDSAFVGRTQTIWKGRPPVLEDGRPLQTLVVAGDHDGTGGTAGQTVTIEVEAGNAWGGFERRTFAVGGGLSAMMRLGNYEHITAKIVSPIPDPMKVRFAWSLDYNLQPSPLYVFLPYPVPATPVRLPEGTVGIVPEAAGTATFLIDQFAATFVQPAAAGEEIEAIWAAFRYNVATKFIFRLRGI